MEMLNIDWKLNYQKYPDDVEKQWIYFKTKFTEAEKCMCTKETSK